jgi:hypothetical protein
MPTFAGTGSDFELWPARWPVLVISVGHHIPMAAAIEDVGAEVVVVLLQSEPLRTSMLGSSSNA